jgi:hypothetical protein
MAELRLMTNSFIVGSQRIANLIKRRALAPSSAVSRGVLVWGDSFRWRAVISKSLVRFQLSELPVLLSELPVLRQRCAGNASQHFDIL